MGGSGFLGKCLVEKLAHFKYDITIINRGVTPIYYTKEVTQIIADRNERKNYNYILSKLSADIIFDLCAYTAVHTKDVIDIFIGKIEKFIHFSSASIYNSPLPLPVKETAIRVSDSHNTYAYGKVMCEKALEQYSSQELNWFSLRIPAIYGASDFTSREYAFYDAIISNKTIVLPEKGSYLLQNIHIDDISDICIDLLSTEQPGAQHLNISGSTFSLHQYLLIFTNILHKELCIKSIALNDPLFPSYHFNTYPYFITGSNLILDCTRVENLIHFKPKITLLEGLEKTIKNIPYYYDTEKKKYWNVPLYDK